MITHEGFDVLVDAVKGFEGCRLTAYKCPAGIWTIGYGETLGVREGDVWSQDKADAQLRARLFTFTAAVLKKCPVLHLLGPMKTIACIDLAYNIGVGAFGASSVCRHTMRGDYVNAAESFLLWNNAGGKVLPGLTIRRQWEKSIYLSAGDTA